MDYALIALGSAIGGTGRYWLSSAVARHGSAFPWGTVLVNISGCFVIGLFATLTAPQVGRFPVPGEWRGFVMIGICGGYTTFSSFALQTMVLTQTGQYFMAAMNVLLSVALCLLAVWVGHMAATALNP